ncbi:MAG: bifunctional glycosyltransferase family 2/GtrA family protein, partial [Candidatus Berkelbacteria bacterium]|nr:bifunctional glycosyltransferase family 2/GtrA family protein [Candidatus Berkelbacteria bacterium]
MKLPSLSLVFPAYNEEANIAKTVETALEAGGAVANEVEVIVVNDGSKDRTRDIVLEISKHDPRVRLVDNPQNMGYGQTVWNGLKSATKEWVFFSDSDLQFDLKEISQFVPYSSNHMVIVGYRAPRRDPFIRILNAKGWNALVRFLFGLKIKDLDCAFKLFHRSVLKDLKIQSGGATFSAELMTRLQKKGLIFKEIPVTHLPRTAGSQTGANFKVIIRAFRELVKLYRTSGLGRTLYRDVFLFGMIGIVNTILDIAVLNLFFLEFKTSIYVATLIGYLVGSVNGYLMNNHWTYRRLG